MNQVGSAATDAAKERPTSFQCEAVRTHNHGQGASVQVAEATKCAAQAEDARASEPSSGGLARGEKQRAFLVGSTAEGSGESWPFVSAV
ncbi:hypothetical protein CLOM_g17447 [Closterium sp. NIES-68]|nr:hypothetical protein CLOM_g17447 [Closterium sp. NIES-68]